MKQFVTREHELEPVPGLPGRLPAGEVILWQGRPDAALVARHVLKNRWIAMYFLAMAVWLAASGFYDGHATGGIVFSVAVIVALGAVMMGMIELFAWGVEKTTLYTITNERLVMRFGVALSLALNIPYRQFNAADMQLSGEKDGTIAVDLLPGARISWLVQWPHVRGWRFANPQPSLICLADARKAGSVLVEAIGQFRESHGGQARLRATNGGARPVGAAPISATPTQIAAE